MKIKLQRESVCMGDDCNAPNEKIVQLDDNTTVSEFLGYCAVNYVPKIHNSVWVISDIDFRKKYVIGYIVTDAQGNISVFSSNEDKSVSVVISDGVFCRYYYPKKTDDFNDVKDCFELCEKLRAQEN
ncbi:MAG: hypothetical protein Q4E74_08355 [Ruminococcus sp.]|nr:hypothetical protein [Ruminococcus sp.]